MSPAPTAPTRTLSLVLVALVASGLLHPAQAQQRNPTPTTKATTKVATTGAASSSSCFSGYASTPLASKHFTYPSGIPEKVSNDVHICRGTQVGYNICNSTTEGQSSLCQTSFINSIDDFCLWGPREPNSLVADQEGEMVAWCTKPGRGTRLIPGGALQAVQFLKAPAYVQVTGYIDQSQINMQSDDSGGEMDPHGADGQGNPMGGLMFSQAFGGSASNNSAWTQVIEWNNFMGGNMFCLKACDPSNADAANYCQHIYDRIGCLYNSPAAYVNGTFETCRSDNQMFPGIYVGSDGKTSTYTQPAESASAISTMPYTPVIPKSSSCTSYTSAALYTALASVSNPGAKSFASTSASTDSSSTGSDTAGMKAIGAVGNVASSSGSILNSSSSSVQTSGAESSVIASAAVAVIVGFAALVSNGLYSRFDMSML